MKMNEISLEIQTGVSKSLNAIANLVSKFESLNSSSQKVSGTLKKVADNVSPTVNKMNDLSKAAEEAHKTLSESPKVSYSQTWKHLNDLKNKYTELKGTVDMFNKTYPKGSVGEKYRKDPVTKNMSTGGEILAPNMDKAEAMLKDYEKQMKEDEDTLKRLREESKKPITLNTKPASKDAKRLNKDLDTTVNKLKKTKNSFNLFKGLGSVFSKTFGMFSKVGDNVGKTTDKMFNQFKKLGLGLVGVRTAMSVLTKAVGAYLSFDGALQDSVTNSWNMLGSLLAPAIEMIASLFAIATNYVYNFIKALTGIDFVARANAKALKTQAAATKAAGQAQRSLSSMDEITNLQTDSAGGGGADIPQITAPEIDSKAMDFIKELVDKIKAGDWYGAGAYIAEQINKALEKTDVKKFTDKVKKGVLNATDMFNGFVETLNWSLLGEKFSDLAVGLTDSIASGIENVHWDSLGKGISDFLNAIDWSSWVHNIMRIFLGLATGIITIFNNIDFSTLAYNLSQAAITGINDITKFFKDTDWSKVGSQLADIVLSIDWLGLFTSVVGLAAQALSSLPEVIIGFISEIPQKIKDIDWNKVGTDIITLLGNAIKLGLTFMFPMIAPFFDDIVNFAKSAFEKFKEIFAPIAEFFGGIFGKVGEIVGSVFGTIFENIKIIFSNIYSLIKPFVDGLVGTFKDGIKLIKEVFSRLIDFIGNIIGKIGGKLKDLGSTAGNIVGGAFKTVVNAILRTIETVLNTPIKAINGLIKIINKVPGINLGKLNTFNLPRLATGTNNIEQEGIYHLHEGEAVVPKKYNPATGGYDNGADNKQIIDLLIDLNANMLALSEREMAVYMDSRKVAEGIYNDMQTVTKNKNMSGVMKRS